VVSEWCVEEKKDWERKRGFMEVVVRQRGNSHEGQLLRFG
jgi:hypothetical protein